jgi:crotonobetainyl-CoA:carnitine CoA-transferase CaiB-like acyl-CoA transferase
MAATLEHLRVVDAASFLAGPCAATILGDFGADVIKVEPLDGDGHRRLSGGHPIDYTWQLTSRNKRSIALDFSRAEGRKVLLSLVDAADIVLFNLRADQLARYRLDYETLRESNPRLIYAQVSGYGLVGTDAPRRAFDLTGFFARTGIMDVMRHKDTPPPPPAGGVGDHVTAMSLFGAIMLALYRRERTGVGAMVSTSLAATGTWANGLSVQAMLAGLDPTERRDREGHSNPFTNVYTTADGRHVMLALALPWKEWPKLARALGHAEWIDDARFADLKSAMSHRDALRALIAEGIGALAADEVDRRFRAEGIPYSIVARLADVVHDPQLVENGVIVATDSNEPGFERTLATPFALHDEPQRTPGRAPSVGAHTRSILAELGLDDAAMTRLFAEGVVGDGS